MRGLLIAGAGIAIALSVWVALHLRPREFPVKPPRPTTPVVEFEPGRMKVRVPGQSLVANLATFDDELLAFLFTGYVRGLVAHDGYRIWLTCERRGEALEYVIRLDLPDDLLSGLGYLFELQATSGVTEISYFWASPRVISGYESQSQVLDRAYNVPARRKLELLSRVELVSYIRRFIRFKALTDRRIRRAIGPIPTPPTRSQSHQLAMDIVAVTDFYSLPIDFFLGIGAMENNYMNVKGDLGNAIWKRRAHKGDVILKHGPRGVLVLNEASGIWQITRETLRYAHNLFLKDVRDYSKLPEHLRPPKDLDLNDVPPEVLTTYAGLFFRELLDRFQGDVAIAVGAYNGGPGNPNQKYEASARVVAEHARRVLEHAAALHGRPAAELRFLTSAR